MTKARKFGPSKPLSMIIPNDDECMRINKILLEETDPSDLTEWEYNFVTSNQFYQHFSDKQKLVYQRLQDKYDVS